jgi:CheY-like chemotaxis protein
MNYKNNYYILMVLLTTSLLFLIISFYFFQILMILFSLFFIIITIIMIFFMNIINQKKNEKITGLQSKCFFISEVSKNIAKELEYALIVADKDFNIVEISSNFKDIFCIKDDVNIKINQFIQENIKNSDSFNKKIELLQKGNILEKCSMELILKNNKIIKMSIFYINNSAAIKKEEYIFLFKDFTEERKSFTNFEILISNIDEMTAIYDIEMKVIKYNAAYRKFFMDFEEIEIHARISILEYLVDDKYLFWKEIFEKGLNGEKVSREVKYFSKFEKKVLEISIDVTSIYNSSTEITGFIINMKDISHIKSMELEIANLRGEIGKNIEDKEIFFDNLNSEIRTPMNNIINGIELINERSEKEREIIEIIKNSGDTLLNVLNDMSDYLKIGNENTKLKKEMFDIEKAVLDVCQDVKNQNKLEDLNIKVNSLNIINRDIYGDFIKFQKIIKSIINNIVKIFGSNQISIEIKEIETKENSAEFEIEIINEKINEFEYGKSISLLIAEKMIVAMNGKILFQGNIKDKTKFCFKIKFEKFQKSIRANSRVSFDKLKNKKVLIVEDNRMNQIVMEKLLKMVKIETDLAENGSIAFDKYRTMNYDLILMDIQMPVMNGYETSKSIRKYEKENGGRIPIIALTAYAMQSDKDKCIDAGMDDYMSKPVIKNELFEMLEKYIR